MKWKNFTNIIYYWKNRHDPECANSLAEIAWRSLLLISVLFVISISIYSGWIFFEGNSALDDGPVVGDSETLSREALSSVLDQFEQREQKFESIKRNPPSIADPSR
jgi:hypothetical protein